MPTATASALLVDAFGRPYTLSGGSGNLYRPTKSDGELRPTVRTLFADYQALLAPHRYRELVTLCRSIATVDLVDALLESRADYVSGSHFRTTFLGADETYGADLLAALEEAHARCNLRGPRFDWRSSWRLGSITRATDGSYFVLLTQWEDGWPAMQIFEGHRIWQRDLGKNKVDSADAFTIDTEGNRIRTPYVGLSINQGVITNANGFEVAFRVLGAADDGSEDQDISARDMIHVARPKRHSEGRPAPGMSSSRKAFLALGEATEAQLDQQIIDATRTAIESNASGKAPHNPGEAFGQPNATVGPTEVYERAGVKFVKSGYEVTPWETARPSDQWMNFDKRVASRAAAAIRWRIEMIDVAARNGANVRALEDQINTTIQDEYLIDAAAAIRVDKYFASKLVQIARIKNHAETRALGSASPPYFSVDRASAKYDLDDVAAGRTSMTTLHARDGHTDREVYTSRARAYKEAQAVSAETGVPLEIVLGDLGATVQRTGALPAAAAD